MSRARLTLNGLNTDCLELIFSHLSTREIAAYVAPVSKEWRQIALNLTTKVFVYNEKATPYILKTPASFFRFIFPCHTDTNYLERKVSCHTNTN